MSTDTQQLRRLVEAYREAGKRLDETGMSVKWSATEASSNAMAYSDAAMAVADAIADSDLLGELDRLRAIVEKLPLTADGVPVVPGMEVHHPQCDICLFVPTNSMMFPAIQRDGSGVTRAVWQCYSTFAAAEAARQREGGKP